MTTVIQRIEIANELNSASRQRYLPIAMAVIGSICCAVWYIAWNDHTLFWKRFAMWTSFPLAAWMLVSTWFVMIAYDNWRDVKRLLDDDDEPEPPQDVAHDILNYAEHRPNTARIETQTSDNQILLSRYEFEPSDWRLLVRELRIIYPRWTRKALNKTKLFPGITAPGEFGKVCSEFERMGVIRGKSYQWRVTRDGWIALHNAANMKVIT